ncbi:hypothetical protein TNIN_237641 [Trichonephila inaurata madagascariensis]|uniref:Uncharacterized protein n=1 Tax=Trichonephila inaurata madagascariensis TaxID=2747483 RepID=A0A8X6MLX7_9ARAC|nr:hypothetical protein TNIN_237641 [Trichonephila inaurata madagascariensis]
MKRSDRLKSVPFSRSNPTNESPVDQATRGKMGVATIDGSVDCPPDLIAILKANTRCLVSWNRETKTRKKTLFPATSSSWARCRWGEEYLPLLPSFFSLVWCLKFSHCCVEKN